MYKKLFFIPAFILFSSSVWAVEKSDEAWGSLTLMGKNDNWLTMIEPQYRVMSGDTPVNNQTLFNAGEGYQVSQQWQAWLGGTWATTSQDTVNANHDEYRIWQQAVFTQAFGANTLTVRTRLEERKSMDFADWSYRLRSRPLLNIPITNPYSLVFSDEFFINLNEVSWVTTGTWDINRAYIGIARKFTQTFTASIGYLNQYVFTTPAQSDDVLAINFLVNF